MYCPDAAFGLVSSLASTFEAVAVGNMVGSMMGGGFTGGTASTVAAEGALFFFVGGFGCCFLSA